MQNIRTKPIYKMTISCVMIALASVLSLIKVFEMPLGGSVTLLSMLPILMVSYMFGLDWGIPAAFVFSLIQLFFGITLSGLFGWGLTPVALIGTIFLDYLLPFTFLGFAGVFSYSVHSVSKRKIAVSILLSIITLGLYKIYWHYLLVKNTHIITKNESGCVKEMLCLTFVPFYSLYWWFTRGKQTRKILEERGEPVLGSELEYLILWIHGLDIISMAIMQNDFNSVTFQAEKKPKKNSYFKMCIGAVLVIAIRGILHFLSGVIIFAQFEQFVVFGKSFINRPILYSLCYNGMYMIPELVLTTAAVIILLRLPQIRKLINGNP